MPKYLALIYGDEATWAAASPEWHRQNGERHAQFNADAGGAVLGGAELAPTTQAVTVRSTSGSGPKPTDGPFLETKEVVGGYYLLEAANMDEAIALASRIPEASAPTSGVEIRGIVG